MDRPHDRAVLHVVADALHERAVDLEGIDREPLEVAERGIAGAEVVDGELDPEGLEGLELASVVGASCRHGLVISRRRSAASSRVSRSTAAISSTRPGCWSCRPRGSR